MDDQRWTITNEKCVRIYACWCIMVGFFFGILGIYFINNGYDKSRGVVYYRTRYWDDFQDEPKKYGSIPAVAFYAAGGVILITEILYLLAGAILLCGVRWVSQVFIK